MRIRLLILLVAWGLQCHYLTQDMRFHPDEAFFMTFARNASVNGDWMLSGALDKPPLSIYGSALFMQFVAVTTDNNGVFQLDPLQGEFAGRLPGVLYAILLVALIMRLADNLYRQPNTTYFAGILMATSPYLLVFGASAFTDMSLLFWGMLAVLLSRKRHDGLAGVAFGLALWSKQQAIFFLPLLLIVRGGMPRRMLASALTLVVLLLLWDASRSETSIFLLGTVNNSPDSLLASPADYLARLQEWGRLGGWLLGHPLITTGFILITALQTRQIIQAFPINRRFWLFIILYVGLHTVLALNQYDRYLLVILPIGVLLCAQAIHRPIAIRRPILLSIILSMLIILWGSIPIGHDNHRHRGINRLADYLNRKPVATVIYDRWLGWELGYYMGQWTDKRRVYFPTPEALLEGALALDEIGDRYFVAPIAQPIGDWLSPLMQAGFSIKLDFQTSRFKVYRLSVPVSDA